MLLHRLTEQLFGTTIKPHERRIVVLLTLNLFVVLTVYYILKIIREPLILLEGGVVERNAARGSQAIILTVLVPAYSALANRMSPRRLVSLVYGVFLVTLLSFPVLMQLHVKTGFPFFVWLGIFSLTAVAQFWSLANDLFTEEAGKRLFPVVAAGATVGAIAGSQTVVLLNRWLTPASLILVAAALLAVAIWLTRLVRRAAEPPHAVEANALAAAPSVDRRDGFHLVLSNKYLLAIGLSILVLNLVNTTGDQAMALLVQQHAATLSGKAARAQFMMSFYGNFQTWISVLTAVTQVFLVGRLLKLTGVRGALMVLPLVAFTGYAVLAFLPALAISRSLKIFENSTEYSLQNTIQQVLFLPTSREVKYKGKAATDTFFVRFGDLASWAVVALALRAGWGARALSLINVGAAVVWLGLVLLLARRYFQMTAEQQAAAAAAPAVEPVPAVEGIAI